MTGFRVGVDIGGTFTDIVLINAEGRLVTKKISEVVFDEPGLLGDVVEIWCKAIRLGRTSVTLDCRMLVRREREGAETIRQICHCEIVYVALNEEGRPTSWHDN